MRLQQPFHFRHSRLDTRAGAIRAGVTLVETMVVIAVVIVLLGLLFPVVLRVRATSAKSGCQLNLQRIGMGMTSYYDMTACYPAAWKGPDNHPGWGWAALLLPHVGQKDLYTALGVNVKQFGDGELRAQATDLTQTAIDAYRCPDDRGGTINTARFNHGLTNYQAVWGTGNSGTFVVNQDRGGVMFQNSRTDWNDIPDGVSNTFLVGETVVDDSGKRANIWPGMSGTGVDVVVTTRTETILIGWIWFDWWWWDWWWGWGWGYWYPVYYTVTYTTITTTYTTSVSDVAWWLDDGTAVINGTSLASFSSRHAGGANFLFCDGSVRFIREGGEVSTIQFLANRRDGTIVNLPEE